MHLFFGCFLHVHLLPKRQKRGLFYSVAGKAKTVPMQTSHCCCEDPHKKRGRRHWKNLDFTNKLKRHSPHQSQLVLNHRFGLNHLGFELNSWHCTRNQVFGVNCCFKGETQFQTESAVKKIKWKRRILKRRWKGSVSEINRGGRCSSKGQSNWRKKRTRKNKQVKESRKHSPEVNETEERLKG